ncbi:hypothetical protein [Parasitella parasitica]|uniref:Uncharacterized protein n=1 Tax=Parasitella parasitica TaxID=35722 RepID=A0A0B7NRB2_9FUNG|nr:hypothetical protein [Parasitella parasitica]
MISLIQELDMEAISRSQAIVKLLQLDLLPHERKFANGLAELVKKLPRVPMEEDANESELITRFVDPFLCGLFDDPEGGVFIRWTNDITVEAQKKRNLVDTSSRSYRNRLERCEMNVLTRVAISCKNALDAQNLEGILSLQIIGRSITFYLLVLPSEGLHVMYKLGILQLPNNLCDLRKLLRDIPLGLLVLDVFHRLCIPSVNPFQPSRHRPTVSESNFDGIFSDRKQSCHLKNYN